MSDFLVLAGIDLILATKPLHAKLHEAGEPPAERAYHQGSISLSARCVWLVRAGVQARRSLVLDFAEARVRILLQPRMLQGDDGRSHQRVVVGNKAQGGIITWSHTKFLL